jgi:MarR family transcriptional regulator, transcriptional regulator for hemolysin
MSPRPDLAASTTRLSRALVAAEGPILERHGLSMWAYVVLLALGSEPSASQGALADSIGADRTRIIAVLDELHDRGLIARTTDPADRRVRLISITTPGRRVRDATQRDIQRNEQRLLDTVPAADRRTFLRVVELLADAAPDALA